MTGADQSARSVRGDEADESDDTDGRHARRREHRSGDEHRQAHRFTRNPDQPWGVIIEGEQVELARPHERQRYGDEQGEGDRCDIRPRPSVRRSGQPGEESRCVPGVRADEEQCGQRGEPERQADADNLSR